jgi:sugar/nucleoside kinase (ribokinase family)
MKNYDLIVYGNITFDLINKANVSIGGIGNIVDILKKTKLNYNIVSNIGDDMYTYYILNHFKEINNNISVFRNSKNSIAKIDIVEDKKSIVNWSIGNNIDIILGKSKWHHIMYADIVRSIDFSNKNNSIISIDTCTQKDISHLLPFVDYMIVSHYEFATNKEKYLKYKNCTFVVHDKDSTILYNNENELLINNNYFKYNKTILGAGDKFAMFFIISKLRSRTNLKAINIANRLLKSYIYD